MEQFGGEFSSLKEGDYFLSSCFRAMKAAADGDKDDVVRFQAEQTLLVLDAIARHMMLTTTPFS